MAMCKGSAIAFKKVDSLFCSCENISAFVTLLIHRNITIKDLIRQVFFKLLFGENILTSAIDFAGKVKELE